jgi:hypothetical protein
MKDKILRKRTLIGIIFLVGITLFTVSCDQLAQIAQQTANGSQNNQLTQAQVTEGLKTALSVGAENSVNLLHAKNGYFTDQAVKIFLPKEASDLLTKAKSNKMAQSLGLDKQIADLEADVILRINRAAEDAAVEAKPIIVSAITNLSLPQAWDILKGRNPMAATQTANFDSAAATHYLQSSTYPQLKQAFEPKINVALDKKLVGNISTNEAWTKLTTVYNKVAPYIGGQQLNPSLSDFVTTKALDGLFYKVALTEKDIRKNPAVWAKKVAKDILNKVFGR